MKWHGKERNHNEFRSPGLIQHLTNDVHRHIQTYSNTGKLWKAVCVLSTRMMSPGQTGLIHTGRGLVVVEPRCGDMMWCYDVLDSRYCNRAR